MQITRKGQILHKKHWRFSRLCVKPFLNLIFSVNKNSRKVFNFTAV